MKYYKTLRRRLKQENLITLSEMGKVERQKKKKKLKKDFLKFDLTCKIFFFKKYNQYFRYLYNRKKEIK